MGDDVGGKSEWDWGRRSRENGWAQAEEAERSKDEPTEWADEEALDRYEAPGDGEIDGQTEEQICDDEGHETPNGLEPHPNLSPVPRKLGISPRPQDCTKRLKDAPQNRPPKSHVGEEPGSMEGEATPAFGNCHESVKEVPAHICGNEECPSPALWSVEEGKTVPSLWGVVVCSGLGHGDGDGDGGEAKGRVVSVRLSSEEMTDCS